MDYEQIIKESVYEQLREKVRGRVSCWVKDDTLHMKVTMIETTYERELKDLSSKVLHGLSTQQIANDFCRGYRNYVLGGFFK